MLTRFFIIKIFPRYTLTSSILVVKIKESKREPREKLMSLRETALKLFAKVYGIKTATTYLVKKQFSNFRATKKDHWEFLIIKLLRIYRQRQEKQTLESSQDLGKLSDRQLKELAVSRGLSPDKPRFLLLQSLGHKEDRPKNNISSLTAVRGKRIKEWNGKL